ncbi:hypothetical protein [Streptomyces sp. NPDC126499]|uniref:hypothetical protein n=1 Tax=Streptomyces sp. NPDC126499 TaxID=3155314 RepID=UPI003317310A
MSAAPSAAPNHPAPSDALQQLHHLAKERAFGRHVGSDRLVQAGLDALLAGVSSPSLALLAGLTRSEEPDAPPLFDLVLEELGLSFRAPDDPRAALWAEVTWVAEQIVDGTLDPAAGADLIWAELSDRLGHPEALGELVDRGRHLACWEEAGA